MKVIVFDTEKEKYKIAGLQESGPGKFPVCTVNHFFDTVCSLFEDVTPNSGTNPMFQDVEWEQLKNELGEGENNE